MKILANVIKQLNENDVKVVRLVKPLYLLFTNNNKYSLFIHFIFSTILSVRSEKSNNTRSSTIIRKPNFEIIKKRTNFIVQNGQ